MQEQVKSHRAMNPRTPTLLKSMSSSVAGVLCVLTQFVSTTPWGSYFSYHLHFIGEGMEAQRGNAICLSLHS